MHYLISKLLLSIAVRLTKALVCQYITVSVHTRYCFILFNMIHSPHAVPCMFFQGNLLKLCFSMKCAYREVSTINPCRQLCGHCKCLIVVVQSLMTVTLLSWYLSSNDSAVKENITDQSYLLNMRWTGAYNKTTVKCVPSIS